MREFAKTKGGKCLSNIYINSKTKLEWECKNRHKWFAKWDNIRTGKWCPKCGYKSQRKLFEIFSKIFPKYHIHYNYTDFDFLYNKDTKRKQQIDIFIHNYDYSFSLAVEYDGEQHFRPVRFGGMSIQKADKMFEYTKRMDKMKSSKIISDGINKNLIKHFIRFSYKDNITMELVALRLASYEII